MASAAVGFLGHYQVVQGWQNIDLSSAAWLTLAALIVFSTVLPLLLMAEGVRRVGASRAALISTLGPRRYRHHGLLSDRRNAHSQPASRDSGLSLSGCCLWSSDARGPIK